MTWLDVIVQGILLGGLYALFATGLSLAFGVLRFVNLAHGDLAILSAYIAFSSIATFGFGIWPSLLVVIPLMVVLGYAAQRIVFVRTMGDDPLPSILVTFGIGIIIQNGLLVHYSATNRSLPLGDLAVESFRITDSITVGWYPLLILGIAIAVLGSLHLFLARTATGRAFRAVADDRDTARLMGIDQNHVYGLAMAIAFATVALAGVLVGGRGTFAPYQGPALLLVAFEAVVIGGLGSIWGTLLGGIVIGIAQTTGNQIATEYGFLGGVLLGHLVFLAVLLIRPTGLLGHRA